MYYVQYYFPATSQNEKIQLQKIGIETSRKSTAGGL